MHVIESRPSGSAPIAPTQLAAGPEPSPVVVVNIRNMRFETPEGFSLTPGTVVEFVNLDRAPHSVTARNTGGNGAPLFDLRLRAGERGRLTFTEAHLGTQPFFCIFHPHMTGSVVVRPASALGSRDVFEGGATTRSSAPVHTAALAGALTAPRG